MVRRIFLAVGWTGLFLSLIACGGGGGGSNGSKGVTSSPLNVNIGDAPTDRIVAFELTIGSVALSGVGVNTTVLSTPTVVEFSHLSGTVAPLSLSAASNVAYSTATITVLNPKVTIIDDLGNPVAATVSLPQTSFSVPMNVTFSAASTLNLDLNVAQSVSLNLAVNPPAATVTPAFSASVVANAASSQQKPETGGFEDVTGAITATTSSSFTISVAQTGQTLTFNTDSNTSFSGVSGVSSLQTGTIVEVNGVTRSDGTLLATTVDLQVGVAGGLEVEGLVTSVTGNPVTSLDMVVRDEASSSASKPALGDLVTTNISAVPGNKFLLNSAADLTGLTVAFNASLVALGQELEIDASTPAPNNITANQVQLRDGTLTGTITGTIFPLPNGGTQFTIALPADSELVKLTSVTLNPVTSVTVIRQPSTQMLNGVTITPAMAVRVRGPLFFDGANYTLVAVRMTTP